MDVEKRKNKLVVVKLKLIESTKSTNTALYVEAYNKRKTGEATIGYGTFFSTPVSYNSTSGLVSASQAGGYFYYPWAMSIEDITAKLFAIASSTNVNIIAERKFLLLMEQKQNCNR